jgi:hypothetical protein
VELKAEHRPQLELDHVVVREHPLEPPAAVDEGGERVAVVKDAPLAVAKVNAAVQLLDVLAVGDPQLAFAADAAAAVLQLERLALRHRRTLDRRDLDPSRSPQELEPRSRHSKPQR